MTTFKFFFSGLVTTSIFRLVTSSLFGLFNRTIFGLVFSLLLSPIFSFTAFANERHPEEPGSDQVLSPKETWEEVNDGLPRILESFSAKLNPEADYVTLIAKAPKNVMDLRSAENFRRSILAIPITDASDGIGHMMVAWQCHNEEGKLIQGGASMTGEQGSQTINMIKAGWGQTAFLATFSDGSIEGSYATDDVMDEAVQKGMQVAHLTVKVPRKNCQNMLNFLKEFIFAKNQPLYHFGNNLEPLNFEGGGCGSFATALLSKAGVFEKLRPLYWRTLKSSKSLLGGGPEDFKDVILPKNLRDLRRYVNVGHLQGAAWTEENGPEMKVLDPEMLLLTLRTIARQSGVATNGALSERKVTSTWSEAIEGRFENHVEFYPINQIFDRRARAIMEGAIEVTKSWKAQGMKARGVNLGISNGLLVE